MNVPKKPLILYGNGQMSLMIYEILKSSYKIVAFTTNESAIGEATLKKLPVLAFESIESAYNPKDYDMFIAVGYSDMNQLRIDRYNQAKKKGYNFIKHIDQSAKVYDVDAIGDNTIILEFSSIHPNTNIGHSVFISSNTNIGHDCSIENGVWINAGVSVGGATTIEEGAFVGMNAVIGHNVNIGAKTFIGAQSLVTNNTESQSVLVTKNSEKIPFDSNTFLRFQYS